MAGGTQKQARKPPPEPDGAGALSEPDWKELAAALRRDGFCKIPGLLDQAFVERLRASADRAAEEWQPEVAGRFTAQGSMVGVPDLQDPVFGELIGSEAVLAALERLGLGGCSFTDGYLISKPGRSPRLFWHFDWFGWEDESAHTEEPVQFALMYYLVETSREKGCLRVIPGSHRRRHALHDVMADGHRSLGAADDQDRVEFQEAEGEVDVPVAAGDALVVDARLLHAAHANQADGRRSLITLWYQPRYESQPDRVKTTLAAKTQTLPSAWPDDVRARVARLLPKDVPEAEPLARTTTGPRP